VFRAFRVKVLKGAEGTEDRAARALQRIKKKRI
jgi:hypothetical protein